MICKTFEVRDRGTFIPVLAVKLEPCCEADRYLLARSGYGRTAEAQSCYVLVSKIYGECCETATDPSCWSGGVRSTMTPAHEHIRKYFDTLESGAVVDVEFIAGLTPSPKQSEAVEDRNLVL